MKHPENIFNLKKMMTGIAAVVLLILIIPSLSFADDGGIDKADTAFIMMSAALVMFMTLGLALFYAGMARRKNVLGTMMHTFFIFCLVSLLWVIGGYTLSFGPDVGGVIGSLDHIFLKGVGFEANGTIPHMLFMVFQGMFAAITVALISGGFAERVKFSAVILFSVLWLFFIYSPLCHWVWGGGWLQKLGALDFAGGMVVHISCGVSALVAAIVIGKRKGFPKTHMPPHNLSLTVIGMAILWFGWFGFNAGSALAADETAVRAFVITNTAAVTATVVWVVIEWLHRGKPTLLGAVSGAVAGLGSVTPASGFVDPWGALLIGVVGGSLCYLAVSILKPRLGYDDTLDVFGIHGVGGIWGTLAIGLFATAGATGLFTGGGGAQLYKQAIGVIATIGFSAIGTYIIVKVVSLTIGFRVNEEDEVEGLDYSQHGESGYHL